MSLPWNLLSSQRSEVKQAVRHKDAVQAPSIRRVRMEQIVSFLVEDTQARVLALKRFLHRLVLASLSVSTLAKTGRRRGDKKAEGVLVAGEG
jgi:hypothetical protein